MEEKERNKESTTTSRTVIIIIILSLCLRTGHRRHDRNGKKTGRDAKVVFFSFTFLQSVRRIYQS